MDHNSSKNFIIAGPLNLNKIQRQACTVMGSKLTLDHNEFDALFLLAANEDEHLTLQQIYEVSWGREDAGTIEYASAALDKLINQVNDAGNDFMWIEKTPELGYKFKTRWGRRYNMQNTEDNASSEVTLNDENKSTAISSLINGAEYFVEAIRLVIHNVSNTSVITATKTEPLYI